LNIAFAFWRSTLLLTADEIGLFTAVAVHPLDAATIRNRLGLDCETASDLLNALTELNLLEYRDGRYGIASAARCLDPAAADYVGAWLEMARAAQREAADFTTRLRSAETSPQIAAQPVGQLWDDLAAIIDANPTH
jgi:hypothetical protein